MSYEPHIEVRTAQPYAGIRRSVTMDSLSGAVDEGFPELSAGWPSTAARSPDRRSSATS
jgi:hypothetical protein